MVKLIPARVRLDFQFFFFDIFPDIALGPVREWKYPRIFTRMNAGVVKIPNFRALVVRVPLPVNIAKTKKAFFGAYFVLIPSRSANAAIELKLFDGLQQCSDLRMSPLI